MNIDFVAPTIELTDEIRGYVLEKLESVEKLLMTDFEDEVRVEVKLVQDKTQQSGEIYRADFTIDVSGKHTHAVGHGESIHAAIDKAKDELTRRLRRKKGKSRDRFIRGAQRVKKMLRFWE